MNEIEKAIQELEDEAYHHSLHPEISDTSKAVALAALREKLEKSEGCDFCSTEYDREDWRDGGAHDFRLDGDALCYFDAQLGWEGMKVKFCPFCGRQLTDND